MNHRRNRPRKMPRACRMCKPRRVAGNSRDRWARVHHGRAPAKDPLVDYATKGRHKVALEAAA